MSEILRVNATGQVWAVASGNFFCERATLTHGANATLKLFDGATGDNNLIVTLGCVANGSDQQKIDYNFKNGIYAELTSTGSGFGVGLIYQR